MPKEVKSWQAGDGSLHDTMCAAATRDIELLVQRSPLAENQPYAKKLVEWLTDNAGEIATLLREYGKSCPVEKSVDPTLLPGITTPASEAELQPHMRNCKARASGYFHDCTCGVFSSGQIEQYRREAQAVAVEEPAASVDFDHPTHALHAIYREAWHRPNYKNMHPLDSAAYHAYEAGQRDRKDGKSLANRADEVEGDMA